MYKATKLPNALYLSNLYTVDPDLVQKSKVNEIVEKRSPRESRDCCRRARRSPLVRNQLDLEFVWDKHDISCLQIRGPIYKYPQIILCLNAR